MLSSARGLRIVLLILCAVLIAFSILLYGNSELLPKKLANLQIPLLKKPQAPRPHHIIDDLVAQANADFDKLLAKETFGVERAAAAYRKRRGRHPPPQFDAWVEYAESQGAVIVEDLFDQIYTDLEPFWALPAADIRQAALSWVHVISVRDHAATYRTDADRPWMELWHSMIQQLEHLLPDVDVAINEMDESRLLVPWETINEYMGVAAKTRHWAPPTPATPVVTTYASLNTSILMDERPSIDNPWITSGNYWNLVRAACPPDSAARTAEQDADFSTPAVFPPGYPFGTSATQGYVSNWTTARDACLHPHLRNLHGTFVEPLSMSTSTRLVPLFGGSKLAQNNEILLPPAMYWTDDEFYSGGDEHVAWAAKRAGVMWRGSASGGRNRASNWRRFQRHRFVSLANASHLLAEQASQLAASEALAAASTPADADDVAEITALAAAAAALAPHNLPLQALTLYNTSTPPLTLAAAAAADDDVAFVHLLCFPGQPGNAATCPYTSPFYAVAPALPMRAQYAHKYLPDLDGNSFSGRYRGFLRSNSLPLKATLYAEFHDSRLLPWRHFVPLDNTFVDWFGVLDYFVGGEPGGGQGGHDDVAERIAGNGAEWAARALRKQDMLVYVYRLLLEYARVSAEERERMGWVGDF